MGSLNHVSKARREIRSNALLDFAVHRGPSGTPFEFGVFVTRLHFPTDYPLSPPKMKFISEIFHPNGKNEKTFVDHHSY